MKAGNDSEPFDMLHRCCERGTRGSMDKVEELSQKEFDTIEELFKRTLQRKYGVKIEMRTSNANFLQKAGDEGASPLLHVNGDQDTGWNVAPALAHVHG